jgi:hypothetical protein
MYNGESYKSKVPELKFIIMKTFILLCFGAIFRIRF